MNTSEKIEKLKMECFGLHKLRHDRTKYENEVEKLVQKVTSLRLDETLDPGELRFILLIDLGNRVASLDYEDFTKSIEDRLRIKDTDFYFQLSELENFPDNYQLGHGALLTFKSLPEEVKSTAEDLVRGEIAKLTSREEVLKEIVKKITIPKDPHGGHWLKITTSAISYMIRYHNAFDLAEESLDILRIITPSSHVLLPQYAICINTGENKAFVSASATFSRYPYQARKDYLVARLNKVYLKPSCKLEERVKNALHFFRIAENHSHPNQRIFFYAAAIENLIIGHQDREVIGWKFSQKGAILSADKLNERLKSAEELKQIYESRSHIAHGEKSKYDFFMTADARRYLCNIIWQILYLIDTKDIQTISPLKGKKTGKSLDEYVDNIIYSD